MARRRLEGHAAIEHSETRIRNCVGAVSGVGPSKVATL